MHADAPVACVREEVCDHLVTLGGDVGRQRACLRDELVDSGDVEALGELLLVAQEGGHVVPRIAVDVYDRLTVRIDEDGAGEPFAHRRGHVVVGHHDFVIFFTSFGVVVGHLGASVPQTVDGTPSR